MSKPLLLNSIKHRNLRVITSPGAEYGDNVHLVPVVADELNRLILEYPVFLVKDEATGRFGLHALLGFDPGENLFLEGDTWDASYLPAHVRRQPFMVGVASEGGGGEPATNAVLTINMDSKRVQEAKGQALFEPDGSKSGYLRGIEQLLADLMAGVRRTEAFVREITDRDLVASAGFNITFENGESRKYQGLYTINEERLREIKGDLLESLHTSGYLQVCHLLLASVGQIQALINRRNQRDSRPAQFATSAISRKTRGDQ